MTLHLWRHLATDSLDLDVQPNYVRYVVNVFLILDDINTNISVYRRLTVNDKIFQLRLMDEVKIDSCSAKRSQTTGTYFKKETGVM